MSIAVCRTFFNWRVVLEFQVRKFLDGIQSQGGSANEVIIRGRCREPDNLDSEKTGGIRVPQPPTQTPALGTCFRAYFWANFPAWNCRAPSTPPQEAQTAT